MEINRLKTWIESSIVTATTRATTCHLFTLSWFFCKNLDLRMYFIIIIFSSTCFVSFNHGFWLWFSFFLRQKKASNANDNHVNNIGQAAWLRQRLLSKLDTYKDLVCYNHGKWEFAKYLSSQITVQSLKSTQHKIIKESLYCGPTIPSIYQYSPRGNTSSTTSLSGRLGDPSHWSSSSPSVSNCTPGSVLKSSLFQFWIMSLEDSFRKDESGTQWKPRRSCHPLEASCNVSLEDDEIIEIFWRL